MEIKIEVTDKVNSPGKIAQICRDILAAEEPFDQEKEHFWTFGIMTDNTIKYIDLISIGNLTSSIVHPRETFRFAILKGIYSIVIAHNHITDHNVPSEEDIKVTHRLKQAGDILGIPLLDHVIVTPTKHYSFYESGTM